MANTLRSCIVARPGHIFIAVDASQIELRKLAIISGDQNMLEDLATGDLHLATAIRMFGWTDDEEEMKLRRYKAKTGNFALVYGADEYKLSILLECSQEEAREFMDEHREKYPRLYEWMDAVRAEARRNGYVVTDSGRIRMIPELHAGSWKIREKAERECVNTIIQGSAVDTFKRMMLYMRKRLDKCIRLVLQVHDEMLWEVPFRYYSDTLEKLKELATVFPDYPVKIEAGLNYGEMVKV